MIAKTLTSIRLNRYGEYAKDQESNAEEGRSLIEAGRESLIYRMAGVVNSDDI